MRPLVGRGPCVLEIGAVIMKMLKTGRQGALARSALSPTSEAPARCVGVFLIFNRYSSSGLMFAFFYLEVLCLLPTCIENLILN